MSLLEANLGMLCEVKPGDFFYVTEAELEGEFGFCVWNVQNSRSDGVPFNTVGFIHAGALRQTRQKAAKEVTFAW
jgi:hypothetical protein